jgi:hypothetical protein
VEGILNQVFPQTVCCSSEALSLRAANMKHIQCGSCVLCRCTLTLVSQYHSQITLVCILFYKKKKKKTTNFESARLLCHGKFSQAFSCYDGRVEILFRLASV